MLKKIATTAVGVGLILATAIPAFAAPNDCTNAVTGPFSTNTCNRNLNKKVRLTVNNTGTVVQNVTSATLSGGNVSNFNTSGGEITPGNSNATVNSSADLNSTDLAVSQSDSDNATGNGTNNVTGPFSSNTANVTSSKKVTLRITNNGTIVHNVVAAATSGSNNSSYNTISGNITTGNSTVDTTVTSYLNYTTVNISQ